MVLLLLELGLLEGRVRHTSRVIVKGVHGGDGQYSLVIPPVNLCLRALISKHLKFKEKFIKLISELSQNLTHKLCIDRNNSGKQRHITISIFLITSTYLL